ncbi:hypothetical protein B9Z19DRAFT_1135198 [Tuber borchii]|uniref:Uncharacterized protein n=1 Tax=Tuber borchii TaxID=42251 RepID=A0A2T6ZD24_TUBBO|nr:hypothetical protein B9Z19DRAFT_1135198 [Tuber borchii]
MTTVTEKLDTSYITRLSDIEEYFIGPENPSYPGWTKNKTFIMKNLVIFFIYKELGIIISHNIGHICDGRNPEFCIIHDRKKTIPDYWLRWWIRFTGFPSTGSRAKPLGNVNVDDFNYFKQGINRKFLLVKTKDWDFIEAYQHYHLKVPTTKRPRAPTTGTSSEQNPQNKRARVNRKSLEKTESNIESEPESVTDEESEHSCENQDDGDEDSDDEVLSRIDYPGKAPTPGPDPPTPGSQYNSVPALSSEYLNSDHFSLNKFCEGGIWDPLNPKRIWSLPQSLPEQMDSNCEVYGREVAMYKDLRQNLRTLERFSTELEFSIYLKANGLKVVKQNSIVAEDDQVVISRKSKEQMENDLLTIMKEFNSMMEEKSLWEKNISALEQANISLQKELEEMKEELAREKECKKVLEKGKEENKKVVLELAEKLKEKMLHF